MCARVPVCACACTGGVQGHGSVRTEKQMRFLSSDCDRDQKGVKDPSAWLLAFGKNWDFNSSAIRARKNRPLFFLQTKTGAEHRPMWGARLPADPMRKPHDKANLKREESVCFLKMCQGFLHFFPQDNQFVFGEHPSGLNSSNPYQQVWAVSSQHPPPVDASLIISQLLLPMASVNN